MRVAIATTGRFHVLNLARELHDKGHEIAFWSALPRRTAVGHGLPPGAYRSLAPIFPLAAAHKMGPRHVSRILDLLLKASVDRFIARYLEPCDVFIGMSGVAIESARAARSRYGAKVFIERGSRHILSQKQILDELARISPRADTVPDYAVKREQAAYEAADVVVVPARHAFDSFVERAFPPHKLFLNAYGVDLGMFTATAMPDGARPTVIFVGTWSYRKGCDVLVDAIESFAGRVLLLHVGAVGDAPLPSKPWFTHVAPVAQDSLVRFYARAHAFVLASREEGLALVQAQALACGLPIVCTDRTGGEDLRDLLDLDEAIVVTAHDDPSSLAAGIERALQWASTRFPAGATRDLLGVRRDRLSWRTYGERYSARLLSAVGANN